MVAAATRRIRTAAVLRSVRGRDRAAGMRSALRSEQVFERHEAQYDGDDEPGHDWTGMAVQNPFDRWAEAPEQRRQHEEPRSARHQRQDHEPEQVVAREARGD